MTKLCAEVDLRRQGYFTNFNKNNPVDGYEQEGADSKNQSLIHLILKLSKLSNRVRI